MKCWEFVEGSDKICIIYHTKCYNSATNKTDIERSRKRFENR